MSAAPETAVPVRLPPGPLQWLFPELEALEQDVAGSVSFGAATTGRHARLRVPHGPLGRTARRALVQRLRTEGTEVLLDPELPCPATAVAEAAAAAPDAAFFEVLAGGRVRALPPETRAVAERMRVPDAERRALLLVFRPGSDVDAWHSLLEDRTSGRDLVAHGLIPVFLTAEAHGEPCAETRLCDSWWGLLPGDLWPPKQRRAAGALVAWLWPTRHALWAALVNAAVGGHDLYLEHLLGREVGPRAAPAAKRPLLLAFCGIDGSGKSSHLQALRAWLLARGLRVTVQKFYRHGVFHDTVTDMARLCAGDKNLHLWRLERLCKLMDSVKCLPALERDLAASDVVLFDRSVFTHYAAGAGRSHHDPYSRELLAELPLPHATFWLDVPVADALARVGERASRTIDENAYMLGRYRAMFASLAGPHGFVVLDARAEFEANHARIRAAVAELLP